MFCGSCMHDNTWAKGLRDAGHDVTLIPTYTPIRVDEDDLSSKRVFLGGINIYMESRSRWWHRIPRVFTRWLDRPGVIRLASKMSLSNDAKELGELTIASLQGEAGPQDREVKELAEFLCNHHQPDVICFSNILQVGAVHALRERFAGKLYCVLQGDDIFLQDLDEPYHSQAIEMIAARAEDFDGFIVHSVYYRDFMSQLLRLPRERFHILPLGIELEGHDGRPGLRTETPLTIGYFGRICPEKGFHHSLGAFRLFREEYPDSRLILGGYLGHRDRQFYDEQMQQVRDLGDSVAYLGSPNTLVEKVGFFKQCDLFSMPTVYHEPKGIPVLEAWANGIPVVQPAHGAFPEMLERTQGGLLVPPDDAAALADGWKQLAADTDRRETCSHAGYRGVREHYSVQKMVEETEQVFGQVTRA